MIVLTALEKNKGEKHATQPSTIGINTREVEDLAKERVAQIESTLEEARERTT
jgi:hypothetical protein